MSVQFIGDVPRYELEGKTVLLRVDYNVPLKKEDSVLVVADAARIKDSLHTLRFLLSNGAKLNLISHLGRPKGQPKPECSLLPVIQYLHDRFLPDTNIMFVSNCSEEGMQARMNQLGNGEILALENLRFHAEEEADDTSFAQRLAKRVDIYVNDAFSACHRAHASIHAVANLVPRKYAGFALKKELDFLTTAIEHPDRPLAAVVGGVKVSTKIDVLFSLVGKVDFLLIGGAMVFTFYRALGYAVGDSFVEESSIQTAADILREAVEHKTVVHLAADCVIAETNELHKEKSEGHSPRDIPIKMTSMGSIPNGWTGLDVGKLTINEFGRELYQCHTILWNGPLGMFEDPRFAEGTRAMLEVIVNCKINTGATTIICGGDTVAAIAACGLHFDQFSHVSMGGGAALKLLSGKELPGVAALQA